MVLVNVFGQRMLLKRNPWYYQTDLGKYPFYLSRPMPWVGDPSKL